MVQNIIEIIRKEIAEFAQEKELKMVLDKNNVIYGGIDLTEEVINYIEGKYKEAALEDEENTAREQADIVEVPAEQENNEQ